MRNQYVDLIYLVNNVVNYWKKEMFKHLLQNNDPLFPEQLKQIRLSLNISCVDFAKLCNVSRSCIRRYEDKTLVDAANPRLKNWLRIKEGLDKIKYFEKKEEKLNSVVPKEIKIIPYETFWQYVEPWQTKH